MEQIDDAATEIRPVAEAEVRKYDRAFIGQPGGIGTTSFMILCHAFGNYGMSSILIYYLYQKAGEGGLGFTQAQAAQLVSVYSSLLFMAGILGGYIADRFIGVQRATYIGYLAKTVGYALLAVPGGGMYFYIGSQFILLVAAGCMGNSLNALAGKMYGKTDLRRDTGFSIMYIFNNIGAIAPVITGAIALSFHYQAGFLFAAVVQGIGFLIFALTRKKMFADVGMVPDDPYPKAKRRPALIRIVAGVAAAVIALLLLFSFGILSPTSFSNLVSTISIFVPIVYFIIIITSKKTAPVEATRVKSFFSMFLAVCFTAMIWTQSTSILAIYAAERVDLNFLGITLTPASFQSVPAVFAVICGTAASWLWLRLKNRQPNTTVKLGLGTFIYGLGPVFMAIPFSLYGPGDKASALWLIVFYFIIMVGEALTSPVGVSTATKVAPKAFTAQMVTVWQLVGSFGAGLSALAVNFYREGSEVQYFLFIGGVTCAVGLLICLFQRKLNQLLESK
ncbi:peptide MFS transporter [Faecalispora jeddahensis]|uniref:peptide MFS transporter n=1 Tax=Faecalispora jeddahensis TaxID=1414721 RepID=UPI0027BB214D|nr:oligopeptide:H+ symporter [Faecalispora jeddahensis]